MSRDIEDGLSDIGFHLYDEIAPPLRETYSVLTRIQAALDVSNILKIEELMRAEDPLGWMHNVGDVMQVYANYRGNVDKYYLEAEKKYAEGGHVNDQEKEEAK
jgi:hypothetical protein